MPPNSSEGVLLPLESHDTAVYAIRDVQLNHGFCQI